MSLVPRPPWPREMPSRPVQRASEDQQASVARVLAQAATHQADQREAPRARVETPARIAYDAIRAVNWSTLRHLRHSPARCKWRMAHPEPPKPAWLLGAALHAALLEPADVARRYALCEVRRDARTRAYQDWLADHHEAQALTADEWDAVQGMTAAVRRHPHAAVALAAARTEVTLEWVDAPTGLRCKGRVDALGAGLVELKTARNVAPEALGRAAYAYAYHGQLAWYDDGARVAGQLADDAPPPKVIAVETAPPWEVVVYSVPAAVIEQGRALWRRLLDQYAACQASGYWPAIGDTVQSLELPRWAHEAPAEEEQW